MSKRRRKKKPNLPEATLRRARRQAGLDDADDTQKDDTPDTPDTPEDSDRSSDSESQTPSEKTVERAARRRRLSPVQLERSRQRGELDVDVIEDMLANPTDIVPEEQLREEYGHVLVDLRNMGILAAILMVVLVGLAQFI
jgi:hypothetical protein